MADSYGSLLMGAVQEQSIDRVSFEKTHQAGVLLRIRVRHGRIKLRSEFSGERLPKTKLSGYKVDLRLDGETFTPTSATAATAKFFGWKER